jgi:hypothetical protein
VGQHRRSRAYVAGRSHRRVASSQQAPVSQTQDTAGAFSFTVVDFPVAPSFDYGTSAGHTDAIVPVLEWGLPPLVWVAAFVSVSDWPGHMPGLFRLAISAAAGTDPDCQTLIDVGLQKPRYSCESPGQTPLCRGFSFDSCRAFGPNTVPLLFRRRQHNAQQLSPGLLGRGFSLPRVHLTNAQYSALIVRVRDTTHSSFWC